MTFPVPVTLNRFLAPDFVFSLGIWLSCSGRNSRPTAHLAGDLLETSVLIEHFTAATAALYSRAGEAGVMAEAVGNRNRQGAGWRHPRGGVTTSTCSLLPVPSRRRHSASSSP